MPKRVFQSRVFEPLVFQSATLAGSLAVINTFCAKATDVYQSGTVKADIYQPHAKAGDIYQSGSKANQIGC